MRRRLHDVLGSERGIALVSTVAIMAVLTIATVSAIQFTSAAARQSRTGVSRDAAYHLAEAGLNEAMAVLAQPSNNAFNPDLLPIRTTTYSTGTATWGGVLDSRTGIWTITSTGSAVNPSATGNSNRTIRASAGITPTLTQPLNNPAWNFIYATHPPTAGVCDETIQQGVAIASPLYVNGNLCLQNTATIVSGPLVVKGSMSLQQPQNTVGTAQNKVNEVHVANGCYYKGASTPSLPCGPSDHVFARISDSSPTTVAPPVVYWDQWYLNGAPGPYYPCTTSSGPVPVFDNDQGTIATASVAHRNNSVVTPFNLTPSSSYTCKNAIGELSWNAATHVLTVAGTIFIDGSAYIDNGAVNSYNGQATLYLSGTYLQKNSLLCAGLNSAGTACDTPHWNPNSELLCIVAGGDGGQVPAGSSIQLVSSYYQGALYATNAMQIDTTSNADGPLIGSRVDLGQSVNTSFPTITLVPTGMPSNPTVYAQPNPPTYLG